MQVVIDIDDDYYRIVKHEVEVHGGHFLPFTLIANGTPLLKGHGDLIDRNEARDAMRYTMSGTGYQSMAMDVLNEFYTPTIIESDKEG